MKKIKTVLILTFFLYSLFAFAQTIGIDAPSLTISSCDDGVFTITVTNNGPDRVYNVIVEAQVPEGFFFRGASPAETSKTGDPPLVRWVLPYPYYLDPDDSWIGTITISPDCLAENGRRLSVAVDYDGGGPITATSGPITVAKPNLVIELEDGSGGSALVQKRAVDETAEWYVKVRNTGNGDLFNVELVVDIGSGLTDLEIDGTSIPSGSLPYTIDVGPIASGGEEEYIVTAVVASCKDLYLNLEGTYNGCGEGYNKPCGTKVVEGSIELDYKTPNLDYTFTMESGNSEITIPYCGTETVTVTLTNAGLNTAGNINDLYIYATFPDELELSEVSNYNPSLKRFEIGTIPAGGTTTFSFDVGWYPKCVPVDCESILFEPLFLDDCGEKFYPPAKELPVASAPPGASFTVNKTGPDYVDVGEEGVYTIVVTYSGPTSIGAIKTNIRDTFPPNFSVVSSDPEYDSSDTTWVEWEDQVFASGGETKPYTITLRADSYDETDCGVSLVNRISFDEMGSICEGECNYDAVPHPDHTYRFINTAVLTVEKSGADSLYVDGDPAQYSIYVTYSGPLCDLDGDGENETPPVIVTDTLPDGAVVLVDYEGDLVDPSDNKLYQEGEVIGDTVVWNIGTNMLTRGSRYELRYYMWLSADEMSDPCLCGTIVDNSVEAETAIPSDVSCVVCSDAATFGIAVECDDDSTAPFDITKSWGDGEPVSICEECVTYTNEITFIKPLVGGPLDLCSAGVGSKWSCIDFTEDGVNNQVFEGLDEIVGDRYGGTATFTFTQDGSTDTFIYGDDAGEDDFDLGSSLNLGFLSDAGFPDPVDGTLTASYSLCFYSTSEGGRFFDWSHYAVDGYAPDPDCEEDEVFHEGVYIEAIDNLPNITIAEFCHYVNDTCSNVIMECEVSEFRINIDQSTPSYKVIAVVDLEGNYTYVTDSSYQPEYSGILDHLNDVGGGEPLLPVYNETAGTLTFTIGDLDDPLMMGSGYVKFYLYKHCDSENSISADITYKDNCETAYITKDTYDAPRSWGGDLLVKKTPEIIYVEDRTLAATYPEWVMYVTNRGSGYSYNVTVTDTLGAGLEYVSNSVTGLSPAHGEHDAATSVFDDSTAPVYTWNISYIPPGETVEIALKARVIDCELRTNQVSAAWGCGIPCGPEDAPTSEVKELSANVVITGISNTPLEICGELDSTVSVTFKNIGNYKAFDLVLSEELPDGLGYAGTYSVECFDDGGISFGDCHSGQDLTGSPLKFIFDNPPGMLPGHEYEVTFNVNTGVDDEGNPECDYDETDNLISRLFLQDPCNEGVDIARTFFDILQYEPFLDITKGPSPSYGDPGDTVTWTVSIENTGDYPARDVLLTDTMPSDVTFSAIRDIGDGPNVSGSGPWDLDDMDVGDVFEYEIDGTIGTDDIVCDEERVNDARVDWGCCDWFNNDTVPLLQMIPELVLSQSIAVGSVVTTCGGTLAIHIDNNGSKAYPPLDPDTPFIQNRLPYGFRYVPWTASYDYGPGVTSAGIIDIEPTETLDGTVYVLTWDATNIEYIEAGDTLNIYFDIEHVGLSDDPPDDCKLDPGGNNVVSATYSNSSLCTDPEEYSPEPSSELIDPTIPVFEVTKEDEYQTVPPGGRAYWTITITETGGGVAEDTIYVEDTLGDNFDPTTVISNPAYTRIDEDTNTIYWGDPANPDTDPGLSVAAGSTVVINLSAELDNDYEAQNYNYVSVKGMCGEACIYAGPVIDYAYSGYTNITKTIFDPISSTPQKEYTIGEIVPITIVAEYSGFDPDLEDPGPGTTYSTGTWGGQFPNGRVLIYDPLPTGLSYYTDLTHTPSITVVGSLSASDISFNPDNMTWSVNNETGSFTGPCEITIEFYAHVENIDANDDGDRIDNTAYTEYYISFGGSTEGPYEDYYEDRVDIIEADLEITKINNHPTPTNLEAGDTYRYTLTVTNSEFTPYVSSADAYDVTIKDIVPEGLTVTTVYGGGAATVQGDGTTWVEWGPVDIPLNTSMSSFQYDVEVEDFVEPAEDLENTARVEWTSTSGTPTSPAEERTGTGTPAVNDYFDVITDTVTVDTTSSITKTLDGTYTQVTIPQVMTYTITVGLPRATIPTLTVTDTMDAGIYYIAGTARVTFPSGGAPVPIAPSRIIGPNDGTLATTLGWNTSGYPIASFDNIDASSGNPLVITFDAVVANEVNVQDGLIIGNDAAYDYTDFNSNHHTDSASSRNVQVIEADLVVTKDENDGDDIVSAGDTITYTINVNHTASSHANAYEVVVTDIVPNGYTVILPVPGGGSTSAGPGAGETTITWPAIDTPLSTSVTYTYTVVVDNDVEPAQELENTSRVEWTSWNGTPAVGEERTGSGSGPNDYFDDTSDTVTVNNISSIHKMPDANRDVTVSGVPNLFEVDYTIEVTLPRATIPDLIVTDIIGYLGEGLYYITGAGNTTITYPGGATSNTDPSLSPTNDGTVPVTLTWDFTGNPNLVPTTGGSWNPLTIEFTAVVANIDENNDLDEIRNIASYSYVDFNDVTQGTSDESGLLVVHVPAFTIDKSVADIVSGFGIPTGTTTEVQPGDVIHYSLVINNVGTGVASNVVVTDSLPQYFEYDVGNVVLNVPYADVISPNLRDLTWNLGSIPGGGSVTINVYAVVTSGLTLLTSSYDNVADVTGEDIIGNQIPADNNDHVVDTDLDDRDNIAVTPQIPALEVDKAVLEINGAPYGGGNVTIQPDDYVTYELTVRNVGNGTAYNVGAYDNLPIGMLYSTLLTPSSYTSAAWDLTSHAIAPSITGTSATGVRLTWESPAVDVDLVGGDSYTVEYLVHVDSNIIEGLPAVNYVMGYAIDGSSTPIPTDRNADTLGADNDSTDDAWTSIATREPFLITDKVVSQIDGDPTNIEVAVIDSIVEFTITIENVGLGDAYDIDIHDTLPVGFEYVPGSTVVGTLPGADPDIIPPVVGQDLSWLGFYPAGGGVPFAPGDIMTLVFEAEVTPNSSGGMHLNTMSVDAIDANGNAVVRNGAAIGITADTDEDDADDAEIYVDVPTVPFVLIKEADPRSLGPEGIVHYTVTYTNTRKIRFYDVTITDTMPKGFRYYAGSTLIDGVPDVDPVGDNPYTWTIGTVQPETTITLEYDVVVSHAAKSGANRNTVVLRGRDSAGNPLELTTHAVVSVKRDKFKEYEEFPTETIPEEWIPGEVIEAPEEEEIIPECCLNVWKIALKSQDFGKTLPGMPEIYYQTDIAMYGATEFFMIYDYLSPRLKIEGIDPEDKHLMTGLYNRIIEKLGEYAQYNLGNVVMKSELGIPYMYSPSIISAAKKGNRRPSRILDDRLKDMAKKAGLSDVPDIEPIFLEYFGSYPYLEGKISEGDLAWGERFMDKNIMPAALGFTLLRSAFQIDEFLKSDVPEERFFGLLILSQSLEKLEAMSSDLAVTANFSNPVKYLPHFSRIEVDENRPALKYTVTDDTSTLYDHASVLWGLSKLRSVILHSQDLDVRSNLDFVTEKMNEAYESLEKIHFNEEDNTFISFRVPGDSGDYEITAKDLAFTILAMRSVLRDNRDTTIITEDPKRKIVAAADFMMENMISAKDGGVYTSYSYASSSADTGTRRTLVDNALAIRALLTAYVVTEDRKYRDAALDIYDFMLENLWVEEYLIFVDEERWDYEVVLTPQSIGALIASLRELVLYGDEDMVNDYLDKISFTTERILDQSQLQLYENRFYPWHAPLTLIPEDPNGRSYVKPIITPIRDKEVMRDLAPILVRKMVLNLTPAGAIASGDEDSVYDWNKWKANLRYEVPDLIASTLVDDTFVTDMGMYFSSLIYDYRHNVNRELPSYNPYTADPDIQTYAAYLSDEVSRFNVKNLTLNSNMGIKLYDSGLIMEMAKKAGVSPEKFVRDFVGERVPEPKRPKGIFGGVLGDVKDFVSGDSRKRFDNIIYLEYAQGKPYYKKGIGEGWDEDTFDTRLNPSSVAQTMLRQILFLMDYEERDDLMPADVFEKDVMKLVVVAKHRFLVDLVKDIEKEGLDYIPHGFELKWDRDEDRYVPVVTDKSSELFDQVSLIWAMALWSKARDMGLLDEYEGYIGDKKQDDELIAKFFDALVKYHYDEARGTLVTGSVNAVEIGKALDILTRAVEILPEGENKDKMLDLISAQADFIIDEMLTNKGVLPLVDFKKKYTTDDLCEFESLGTHTFPILALFRAYEVTSNEKYLKAALGAFKIFDESKWIQELGLYMSTGTIWEGKDLTKLELTYNNVELISTILLISELQPYMEGERKILSAYHMTTFMNRLLEIASLERYPENEESGRSIYSPQIVFSVKIILSETKGNGSAGGVFTYLILVDNDCIEEWDVDHTLHRIRIEDTLPKGFHFVPGSTRINGAFAPDPIGKETLNWYYPVLRDSGRIVLRYQVVADENIPHGIIVNDLDIISFWAYNGVLYPCDGFVEEGVRIYDEVEILDELGDGKCVPCDPEELKRIQYR